MKDQTPENLRPYIDVLGEDLTVALVLALGGSPVYLADNPQARSDISGIIGQENVKALAERLHAARSIVRIPINRAWLAKRLHDRGQSVLSIARELHVTDVTVRKLLRDRDDRQLSLL